MECFTCGQDGHIAPNCPNGEIDKSGKPPWCGFCHADHPGSLTPENLVARGQQCHPLLAPCSCRSTANARIAT